MYVYINLNKYIKKNIVDIYIYRYIHIRIYIIVFMFLFNVSNTLLDTNPHLLCPSIAGIGGFWSSVTVSTTLLSTCASWSIYNVVNKLCNRNTLGKKTCHVCHVMLKKKHLPSKSNQIDVLDSIGRLIWSCSFRVASFQQGFNGCQRLFLRL